MAATQTTLQNDVKNKRLLACCTSKLQHSKVNHVKEAQSYHHKHLLSSERQIIHQLSSQVSKLEEMFVCTDSRSSVLLVFPATRGIYALSLVETHMISLHQPMVHMRNQQCSSLYHCPFHTDPIISYCLKGQGHLYYTV